MKQDDGILGQVVGAMIRRTLRARFRTVYVNRLEAPLPSRPIIFVVNHHGWHDGYLMYALVNSLGVICVDWIEEYGAFPLFGKVGGLPFPKDDPGTRMATLRKTIRLMRDNEVSLVLFAEGRLHRPPVVEPFPTVIQSILKAVPSASVVPVAIYYDMSLHERPEAYLWVGRTISSQELSNAQAILQDQLECLRHQVQSGPAGFDTLVQGARDVNERWDMRRKRGRG
ncbi:MAG: 1-acyl-sn-glycerol-3-phosphate acyltransferase [Armatimonadetes bacterium]|nr:1-acyl-sn-glycerol-3-phosphate acyltransferase [Armatimonadota bacterium]